MKTTILFKDTKFQESDKSFIEKFLRFLQSEYPIKSDITIKFLGDREGQMSTGSRTEGSEIKVLAKGRLNRDIMRTLAHEWVHEHQRTILKREKGPDIGGQNEDEANAFAEQQSKKTRRPWVGVIEEIKPRT